VHNEFMHNEFMQKEFMQKEFTQNDFIHNDFIHNETERAATPKEAVIQLSGGLDPSKNGVVFEIVEGGGNVRKYVTFGDLSDEDCLRNTWLKESQEHFIKPELVLRVYSEWEPSKRDRLFLAATFPHALVSFSFIRQHERSHPEPQPVKAKITTLEPAGPTPKPVWRRRAFRR
jgi:hypothetical protein